MEGIVFQYWHIWIIIATVLFIFEIFAPGFVLACLGIGSIGSAITALFTDSLEVQLTVFSLVSIVSFIIIRPLALKTFFKDDQFKSNVDFLIGKTAIVTESFNNQLKRGRVKIDGDDWRAETTTEQELNEGDLVEIIKVESNTLIVSKK